MAKEESVRGKVENIEKTVGNFNSLIDNLKDQNDKLTESNSAVAHNTNETVKGINVLGSIFNEMNANIATMTKAMLGMPIINSDGKEFEPVGLGGDLVATNFILTNIANNIADITDHILKLPIRAMASPTANNLANKEVDREKAKDNEKDDDRFERIAKTLNLNLEELKGLRKDMHKGGILDILVIGAALLSGFVVGLVQKIVSFFAPITKVFGKANGLIKPVIDFLSKGVSGFVKIFTSIAKFFGPEVEFVQKVFGFFAKGVKYFASTFEEVAKVISSIVDLIAGIFGKGKAAVGIFSKLATYFNEMFSVFKIFFDVGRTLGGVIAKLAIPLTVIMGIWDSVSGAIDGWNKTEGSFFDKFIGALKGGLTGLVNGLIGGALDLLKDGVAWVLGWFGAKDAEAWLDSFSFKDIFSSLINGFIDTFIGFVKDVFGAPVRIVQDFMSAMDGKMDWGDLFKRTLANIIGVLLAPVNALGKLAGIDITKEALGMMGLPSSEVSTGGSSSGAALESAQQTNTESKAKLEETKAQGSGTAIIQGGQSVVNNVNQSAAVIKSSTTNWEPDDQWARGGMNWGA